MSKWGNWRYTIEPLSDGRILIELANHKTFASITNKAWDRPSDCSPDVWEDAQEIKKYLNKFNVWRDDELRKCGCNSNKELKRRRKAGRWPPKGDWRIDQCQITESEGASVRVEIVFPCGCPWPVYLNDSLDGILLPKNAVKRMSEPPEDIQKTALAALLLLRSIGKEYPKGPPF